MSEQEKYKASILEDIETYMENRAEQQDGLGVVGEIQGLIGQLATLAATLRIKRVLNAALAANPGLNLGGYLTINSRCFVVQQMEGEAPELIDGDPF